MSEKSIRILFGLVRVPGALVTAQLWEGGSVRTSLSRRRARR